MCGVLLCHPFLAIRLSMCIRCTWGETLGSIIWDVFSSDTFIVSSRASGRCNPQKLQRNKVAHRGKYKYPGTYKCVYDSGEGNTGSFPYLLCVLWPLHHSIRNVAGVDSQVWEKHFPTLYIKKQKHIHLYLRLSPFALFQVLQLSWNQYSDRTSVLSLRHSFSNFVSYHPSEI